MTFRSGDLQSDSDLDSIRNSSNVFRCSQYVCYVIVCKRYSGGFKLFFAPQNIKGRRRKNGYFTVRLAISVDLPPAPPLRAAFLEFFCVCLTLDYDYM